MEVGHRCTTRGDHVMLSSTTVQHSWTFRLVAAVLAAIAVVPFAAEPAVAETNRQSQWYLSYLNISQVHKISTGQGVVVGVVDSGADATHPDLAGRILSGVRSNGTAGSGNSDEDGHGTRMAGIIAATNAAPDGVLGIAPGAKILPIKTHSGSGDGTADAIKSGIRLAVDNGAKIINASWAGPLSPLDAADIDYAISKDAVIVAAAGNTAAGQTQIMWPARIPGVIAVTGLNQQGNFWSGSTNGPEAVVSAPAQEITSTTSRLHFASGYSVGNGTSDATAIISGVAALIRAKFPTMNAANVINRIITTADDAGPTGRDPQYGFGKINALRALTATVPEIASNPLIAASASTTHAGSPTPDQPIESYLGGDEASTGQVIAGAVAIVVTLIATISLSLWLFIRARRRRNKQATRGSFPIVGVGTPPMFPGPTPYPPNMPPGFYPGPPGMPPGSALPPPPPLPFPSGPGFTGPPNPDNGTWASEEPRT